MTSEGNLTLPKSTIEIVHSVGINGRHPGLQLDKYSPPGDQKAQKRALEKVLQCRGDDEILRKLRARRCEHLSRLSARSWSATTAGPLTLHLARASALENAGICLHPLYGFAYLPGSGLKGMARAYAETVWLQAEADRTQGEETIARVFGRARKGKAKGWAGSVIFHDAWPETWPKLVVDIVNNHHKAYYEGRDAPGDWEDPEPSYFLAVPAGVAFSFALSLRRGNGADVVLAKGWLEGALCHLGAGAKTAAGYGTFRLVEEEPPSLRQVVNDESKWAEWSCTLELVTPAFLAGAGQKAEDCDLRPATLRGLLRWWWRTMHTAYLTVEELRALEATVWGSTKAGSPLRITVGSLTNSKVEIYDKDGIAQSAQLPKPREAKTTQGLSYASYGMDEIVKETDQGGGEKKQRRQRYFLPPGAGWTCRLVARDGRFRARAKRNGDRIVVPANLILGQARAALWLLCHFGGVGSRSRKGFGSFKDIDGMSLDDCKQAAERIRTTCGMPKCNLTEVKEVKTPSLDHMLPWGEVKIRTNDPWSAADKLGAALQTFKKGCSDKQERVALGLPRANLTAAKGNRHAAPMYFHISKSDDASLALRVAAFPAPNLPDLKKSRSVLTNLLTHLAKTFAADAQPKSTRRPGVRYARGEEVRLIDSGEIVTVAEDVHIGHVDMQITYNDGEPGKVRVDACEPLC